MDVDVPLVFAWSYMTDVRNWNDPPAVFALEGSFVSGARGTTTMPGQPALEWRLRDVEPERGYSIEGSSLLDRALFFAHWRFVRVSESRTTLRQRLELVGENAHAYVEGIKAAFEPNLEPGMRRIAALLTEAAARAHGPS